MALILAIVAATAAAAAASEQQQQQQHRNNMTVAAYLPEWRYEGANWVDISATTTNVEGNKFNGAAAMGNLVFFAPAGALGIGIFNVDTNDFSILDLYGRFAASGSLFGGAVAINNTIVFVQSRL